MPRKRAAPAFTETPYDLRKKSIPRTIPALSEQRGPKEPPAGSYVPAKAAQTIKSLKRKAVQRPRSTTPARARSTTPALARRAPRRGRPRQSERTQQPTTSSAPTSPAAKRVRFDTVEEASDGDETSGHDNTSTSEESTAEAEAAGDDNLPSDIYDEIEEEAAVRGFFNTKEHLKKVVGKRRIAEAKRTLREARAKGHIDILTSDLEDSIVDVIKDADFPVDLHLRVFINRSLRVRKILPETTRRTFDLADIEEAFLESLEPLVGDMNYDILERTVNVKLVTGHAPALRQDISDFSTAEEDQICLLLDKRRQLNPRSAVMILFEIKVTCDGLDKSKKKPRPRVQPSISDEASSPVPSSPPIPTERPTSNRTRTLQTQYEARARARDLPDENDTMTRLLSVTRCHDDRCTNKDNYCFVDPFDPTQHYNIIASQHEAWANAIRRGEATIHQPPLKVWQYWKQQQGAISRDSRTPKKQSIVQETKSALERFTEMQQQMQEQLLQSRLIEQMETMAEKQERRDERNEQRRWQREQQEQMQMQYQMGMQSHMPRMPSMPHPPLTDFNPYTTVFSNAQPPTLGLMPPRPKSSSPIDVEDEDAQIIETFFNWEIDNTKHPERRDKWRQAKEIVTDNDWSVKDMKQMEDGTSAMYKRAIDAGISDGFTRGFRAELRRFKKLYRQARNESRAAGTLGQMGGFSVFPPDAA